MKCCSSTNPLAASLFALLLMRKAYLLNVVPKSTPTVTRGSLMAMGDKREKKKDSDERGKLLTWWFVVGFIGAIRDTLMLGFVY